MDFRIGDSVFVKKKGFIIAAPIIRLDSQYVGPWRILKKRGFSYILDILL